MGKIILSILLFINLSASATNYYVSSTGNDAAAGSLAAPWRTIDKVNAATFAAGDSILFKRGETFYGTLRINRNNIVVGAYGTGVKPVLSGLTTLTTWSLVSAGTYQSETTTANDNTDIVLINGTQYAACRYPNTGYLTYQSFTSGSLTSSSLTGTPNYTGAGLVWKANRWVMNRAVITGQTGSTISYTNPTSDNGIANFGFFLQKDSRLLDQFGEWWYDGNNDRLRIYTAGDPAAYIIQVSTKDTGISTGSRTNITLENLTVKGYNIGIYSMNGQYLTVKNCNIQNCGAYGIYVWNTPDLMVQSDSLTDILSVGAYIRNAAVNNTTVTGCYLHNIGFLSGMGGSGDLAYKGIFVNSNSASVYGNELRNIGYCGIQITGSDIQAYYNLVDSTCTVKDDGGGIYMYADNGATVGTNRSIYSNIITNSVGNPDGTAGGTPEAKGIYLDGGTMNVKVYSNVIAYSGRSAILANNPYNVEITGNTFFGYRFGTEFVKRGSGALMRTIRLTGNTYYSTGSTNVAFKYYSEDLSTPSSITATADISAMGTLDSNYFCHVNSTPFTYEYSLTYGGTIYRPAALSLTSWRSLVSKESSSSVFTLSAPYFALNTTGINIDQSLPGIYQDVNGNTYTGGISLLPYSGKLLNKIGELPSNQNFIRGFKIIGQ